MRYEVQLVGWALVVVDAPDARAARVSVARALDADHEALARALDEAGWDVTVTSQVPDEGPVPFVVGEFRVEGGELVEVRR